MSKIKKMYASERKKSTVETGQTIIWTNAKQNNVPYVRMTTYKKKKKNNNSNQNYRER